jgi:hypothetical protein
MEKNPYDAQMVKKVRLEVKNAVLGACHTSPTLSPMDEPIGGAGCAVNLCRTYP